MSTKLCGVWALEMSVCWVTNTRSEAGAFMRRLADKIEEGA